jgi:AcrR family transcriptional regulator
MSQFGFETILISNAIPNMTKAVADRKQKVLAEFRRAEILAAAAKVFASKGLDAARMDDIAKAAQVAKGTLYLYFQSKDAIYQAVVQRAIDTLAELTGKHMQRETTFVAKLAAFISVRIAFWHEHRQIYRIILSINRQGQHRKRSIAWQKQTVLYLEQFFREAAQADEIPEQDFLASAWTTMDAIRGVSERRAFSEGQPAEDDARFLTDFLLRALGARAADAQDEPTG